MLSENKKSPQCYCGNSAGLLFDVTIDGALVNYGPQSGFIEDVDIQLGLNNVFDHFLLNKIIRWEGGLREKESLKSLDIREFPVVLQPGQIKPISIFIQITIGKNILLSTAKAAFDEWLLWTKDIDVVVSYSVMQSNRVLEKNVLLRIKPEIFEDAFLKIEKLRVDTDAFLAKN